eukprot:1096319-Pelagomonas_calceolata.AAC.3
MMPLKLTMGTGSACVLCLLHMLDTHMRAHTHTHARMYTHMCAPGLPVPVAMSSPCFTQSSSELAPSAPLFCATAPQPQEPEGASDVGRQQQEDLNAAGAGNPQPPLPSSQPHVASQQQQGGAPNPDHGLSVPHPPPAGFRSALVRDASAIEAVYAYVRQCVRAAHGIRVLKALLQPRASAPSHVI